ncbi:hypothetical protein ACO0LC_10790 [Undibacterium sp. JH2W]|uniref:hypothetical protein n=1 Tax=Undibacterium sp. JH2W TaxID=3413037 RepID=UPI003BF45838
MTSYIANFNNLTLFIKSHQMLFCICDELIPGKQFFKQTPASRVSGVSGESGFPVLLKDGHPTRQARLEHHTKAACVKTICRLLIVLYKITDRTSPRQTLT